MYIFADEAGCFTFKDKQGSSKYFIICTVAAQNWHIAGELLNLRRELAMSGECERDKLHATTDAQAIRDQVYPILAKENFRIDATIIQKNKALPSIRQSHHQFYQYAWYYHFKHIGPTIAKNCEKMLITAAALGENKTRAAFKNAVNNTIQQILPRNRWEVAFHDSAKDSLLWVADYCAWAIQRKWERNDDRSHKIINEKISTEYPLFARGRDFYY